MLLTGKLPLHVEHIVADFCTKALIEKTYDKIRVENQGWSSRFIQQLLGRVYHELVTEECWNFVKKYKNPMVNFKRLYGLVITKVKEVKPELF